MDSRALIAALFGFSPAIRYVAEYRAGRLTSAERAGLASASSSESDKYEELIVNPTLLKLETQRGNIDCGGAAYVLIRYGRFFEFVLPLEDGHLSVGFELYAPPAELAEGIRALIDGRGATQSP